MSDVSSLITNSKGGSFGQPFFSGRAPFESHGALATNHESTDEKSMDQKEPADEHVA